MTESPFGDSGFAVPVFSLGDDPIACLNKAMAFLMAVASSRFLTTNNQLRTSSNLRNQATIQDGRGNTTSSRGNTTSGQARVVKCYNCQGEGHMARQCTQPKRPRNSSWYKEKAMLAEAQEAGQILDKEQLVFLADARILADQAQTIIPHNETIQDTNFQAQQDSMIFSVIEQMSEQMINHVNNWEKANKEQNNESITAELERYKERVKTFEQRLNIDLSCQYFEINDLKARLQDKDTTICKLKDTIKSLRENTKEEKVNPDKCNLEPINKELENSVANLLSENERLCNEINHVKQSKGKEIVENVVHIPFVVHIPSATTIDPGMFKIDLEPLPPRLLQNREVHITYLRNTQEQANILREIVKQAKAKQPLDSELDLASKDGLARGIPRLKFQKDHLCSACALGKSKKTSHQPKAEDTNQEKLYLLHMDLCGPMHVASINGKRYILVIVDDYSRFTWVRFLKTKDEAPAAIIKCIKNIQVRLKATVRNVRTDNGTEFVNQTLREWYENVGISHQTSVARTPQQNGVVERQNQTLVEAARTMLIFSKALLFLWVEAINTTCYTQNRSLICL
ncbi:retrovirus-related pol polyprotein from transposon TNT 1-94 [Tanacetum coccineum]